MPIYEYVCEACGRLTELMQRFSDPPPAACPECGGGKLARLVSRTSFQLKGGGWYSDLYASPKEKKKPDAAPTAGGEASAAASSGTSTPAATPSTSPAPAASGGKPSGGTGAES